MLCSFLNKHSGFVGGVWIGCNLFFDNALWLRLLWGSGICRFDWKFTREASDRHPVAFYGSHAAMKSGDWVRRLLRGCDREWHSKTTIQVKKGVCHLFGVHSSRFPSPTDFPDRNTTARPHLGCP